MCVCAHVCDCVYKVCFYILFHRPKKSSNGCCCFIGCCVLFVFGIVVSAPHLGKRAFGRILLAFSIQYHVALMLTRDSSDKDSVAACRWLLKQIHPDRRGKKEEEQKLQAAQNTLSNRASSAVQGGRPQKGTNSKQPDAGNDE